jgi:predicted metalloprotease
MRWEGNRQSDNVEDRRDEGPIGGGFSFGGGRGIGIGTIVIALVAGWVFGINPLTLLGVLGGGMPDQAPVAQTPAHRPPADDKMAAFVSTILADTEDVWRAQFAAQGSAYREPKLVLFRGTTRTACGAGQAAMRPFYCPGDQRVYIDLGFYETMKTRLGAPGDFAQAYVIAHEIGHHVQALLGVTDKVDAMRQRSSPAQSNALSVRLELQADCLAGVWAFHAQRARQILEQGDVEEALNAASQIGDDTLQRRSQGTVVPETFTHGTSAQRVGWFKRGLTGGNLRECNTFDNTRL